MRELRKGSSSVLEGSAAAGFADELLEHGAVRLPEGLGLGHLGQVVHAEPEAEHLQVLEKRQRCEAGIKQMEAGGYSWKGFSNRAADIVL